jgi:8-oxo-dGTP pyrophosphatase MutT (NUDIX family)
VNAGGLTEAAIRAALARPVGEAAAPQIVGLTCAAVLIPLLWDEDRWQVLFTRRTDRVETHKGQVAFPGGACDPVDVDVAATALRETEEEVGIPPHAVRLLGRMRPMPTVTGFLVTPVVGVLRWPQELRLAEHEVSRAFNVPLDWLKDPANREERLYTRSNGTSEMVVFYRPYAGETIWGVTGRILLDFIALLPQ